jgi:hypothetical protein
MMGKRIIVFHGLYGCETGCCGHFVRLDDGDDLFQFEHPYGEDPRVFAEDMVRRQFGPEHVADLDWEQCVIVDDD